MCWSTPVGCGGRLFESVAAAYPGVTTDYLHVDAATIFLVTDPARFDVVVTDNLFGDILTDLAAAVTGGIGLAASGNINPDHTFPSMFEPVHGSAPDIAGRGIADPTATILSVGCCWTTWAWPRRPPEWRRRQWPTSPDEAPARRVRRVRSGTRLRPRSDRSEPAVRRPGCGGRPPQADGR
jgi:hypothetical protein